MLPADQINHASWRILHGEFDEAIASLTITLKTLKQVLTRHDEQKKKIRILNDEEADETRCDAAVAMEGEEVDQEEEYKNYRIVEQQDLCVSDSRVVGNGSGNDNFSSYGSFEYEFFVSPSSSIFLETTTAATVNEHSDPLQPTSQSVIFREPILVGGDRPFHDPFDAKTCEQLSHVAIYNLALAHHLKAVQLTLHIQQQKQEQWYFPSSSAAVAAASISMHERSRREYLHKALSLYEYSHQISTRESIEADVPVIHTMALIGNLGQIYYELGDHKRAELCMKSLLSSMMYVVDCGNRDNFEVLAGPVCDGFFRMLQPLISRNDPAPAAWQWHDGKSSFSPLFTHALYAHTKYLF